MSERITLTKRDLKFLQSHDFDRDLGYDVNPDSSARILQESYDRVDQFLREQYGRSFTMTELVEETGVDPRKMTEYLHSRTDVEPTYTIKNGVVRRWLSNAKPFDPSKEGLKEVKKMEKQLQDDLGHQAREDYYWTQTRGHNKKRLSSKH